jgi:hypothetical protein
MVSVMTLSVRMIKGAQHNFIQHGINDKETLIIMKLSIIILSILTFSKMTLRIRIKTGTQQNCIQHDRNKYETLSLMTQSIMTRSITTHSITTLCIITLSRMTLSIRTERYLRIKQDNSKMQHPARWHSV